MKTRIRADLFITALVLILAVGPVGCNRTVSAGLDIEHATKVSFPEFKEATHGENKFLYLGSDKDYHYFKTQKGFYRLTTEFEIPRFKASIEMNAARGVRPGTTATDACIVGDKIVYRSSRMDN